MEEFDVLIIGGGPAGTATGLTILKKPGLKVALIEQTDYTNSRIGEVLSPGMRGMLEYFDVWSSFKEQHTLDAFSSQSIWGNDQLSTTDYMFTVHGSGWHLDRVYFDKMLAEKFEENGGTLILNTKYQSAEEIDGNWHVHAKTDGKNRTIKCKYVVDATGRRGTFVQHQNVNRVSDDRLVGVGCFGTVKDNCTVEQSILIEACEYGWWYTAPTPKNQMSVILMTDLDMISELDAAKFSGWSKLLEKTSKTYERIKDVSFNGNPRSFLAHSSKLEKAGSNNWLAVGDALSSHDPLSSSGIPHALGSGAFAGRVAVASLQGNSSVLEDYYSEITNQYLGYLETKKTYYAYEQRWPQSKFWKRRNEAISVMADEVIDDNLEAPEKPVHLLPEQYVAFNELHQKGDQAHTVVSKFKEKFPEVSDQSIILGLQEMM